MDRFPSSRFLCGGVTYTLPPLPPFLPLTAPPPALLSALLAFAGLQMHVSRAGAAYVPTAQYTHDDDPGPGAYVPRGHGRQRPAADDAVPAGQGAQPVRSVKKPAGQSTTAGKSGNAGIGRAGISTGRGGSGIGN